MRELSKWIKNWNKERVIENKVNGRSERERQQGGEAGHWGTMGKNDKKKSLWTTIPSRSWVVIRGSGVSLLLGNRFCSCLLKCTLHSSVGISYQKDGNLQHLLVASPSPCASPMFSSAAVEPQKSQCAPHHRHTRNYSSNSVLFKENKPLSILFGEYD